jgi:phage gpG-like protein
VISVDFRGDRPVLDRLRALPDAAGEGLARAVAKLGIGLQSHIRQDKLSGQVLQSRSGALKASIEVATNRSATAVTATVSTDLDYAAAQEYGFSGTVSVRASLRRIKEAFGRPITTKTIAVGAHSRRMNVPERSFLRSALDDAIPDINAGVNDALREAIAR